MATLVDGDGTEIMLRPDTLVGRSRRCDVCFKEDDWVSSEHAKIHFRGRGWWIKDLGSRNGTTLGTDVLLPGHEAPLALGTVVRFGGRGPMWTLVDDGPPLSLAMRKHDKLVVHAEDEILALPTMGEPEVVMYRTGMGEWHMDVLQSVGEMQVIHDGDVIRVAGEDWCLQLVDDAHGVRRTMGAVDPTSAKIRLLASPDGETITCSLIEPKEVFLGSNVHHHLLMALAVARQRDEFLPEQEQGWRDFRYLSRELGGWTNNAMNVALYRARRQFASIGAIDSASVVERLPGTGLIRLGIRFEIIERKD